MRKTWKTLLLVVLSVCMIGATAVEAAAANNQVSKVKISETKATLGVGETLKLKVTGTKKSVKWSSSNSKVASVSGGKVKGKKAGKATITASVKGKKLKCRVTVKKRVYLSKKSADIFIGKSVQLKVNGTSKAVTWSSSDDSIATVEKGKVTGKKAGTATITAKVDGKSLKCKVKVKHVVTVSKQKVDVKGTATIKVKLHEFAAINCFIPKSSYLTCKWGKWSSWKNGVAEVPLTFTGKKEGTVEVILTNSYNTEQTKIEVNILETE